MEKRRKIFEVKHLQKYYFTQQKQQLKAVDDVSFDIYEGETLRIDGRIWLWKNNLWKNLFGNGG